jgi:hypothetical protein
MTETTHLGLPYLAAAQAQKHVTHNEALLRLDAVVQLAVIDAGHADPPASPGQGDRYIVAEAATGDWAGHDGEIAAFIDGAWVLIEPGPGWMAFDAAAEAMLIRHDDSWVPLGGHVGAIDRLGVNTAADDTNRLAVRSGAVLLTAVAAADGGTGDVRCVLNKEADGDTASFLFQRNYSGRAEIGLAGDTDFVFKVSADGTAWTEAIRIDKTSGRATLAADPASAMHAATKQYVDQIVAAQDAMVFKGVIDCSANPNYPAADRGHTYRVSVAGKIGGGSGVNVEAGDLLVCLTDGTGSANHATAGSSWSIAQTNLDGGVIGPASATDGVPVLFDGTTGKLIRATSFAAFKTALALAKADVGLGSVLDVAQREKLTANRSYYVRTDGTDANDGLANTSGGAFLTLQKAMDVVAALDISTFTVTISVAAGTYTAGLTLKTVVGAGTVSFVGDAGTPGNVVIAPASGIGISTSVAFGTIFAISGFKIAGSSAPDVNIGSPCRVTFTNIEWAGTSNYRIFVGSRGTVVLAGSNHTISGGGIGFLRAESFGQLSCSSITVTLLANVTYSSAFASASFLGFIFAPLITFTLGAFSVTAARYSATMNGVISVSGGGANYFPGSSAGSTGSGGQYA